MGRLGVSADIAVQDTDIQITSVDDMGFPMGMSETVTAGTHHGRHRLPVRRIRGLPTSSWATAPSRRPRSRSRADQPVTAAGIHWMTYEECEACDAGLEVITASGAGPVAPPAAWFQDPGFTPGDGRLQEIHGRRGRSPRRARSP